MVVDDGETVMVCVVAPVFQRYDANTPASSVIGVFGQAVVGPVMVTTGGAVIGIVDEPLLVQEPLVIVTPSVTLPLAFAENVIAFVFCPAVIVPPVMLQRYDDAPAGTEAWLPVDDAQAAAGALIVAVGALETVTVCESLPLQPPPLVTVTL